MLSINSRDAIEARTGGYGKSPYTISGQHFKQLQFIQIPQLQAQLDQNAFTMRTVPVEVEAFHELMGGDSTLKHEPDQNKLTSLHQSKKVVEAGVISQQYQYSLLCKLCIQVSMY